MGYLPSFDHGTYIERKSPKDGSVYMDHLKMLIRTPEKTWYANDDVILV